MADVKSLVLGSGLAIVNNLQALVYPGVCSVFVKQFPGELNMAAAMSINFPWEDADKEFTVEVDVVDENEKTIRTPGQPPATMVCGFKSADVDYPHETLTLSRTVALVKLHVPKPGWYFVRVAINGHEAARTDLRVGDMKDSTAAKKAKLI